MLGVWGGNSTVMHKTKIVGLTVSLLSFLALIFNLWWEFGYDSITPGSVHILQGAMIIDGGSWYGYNGFYWEIRHPGSWIFWFPFIGIIFGSVIVIPLWIPLLLGLIPSFVAWRRSRRTPPHCCQQCGYNLTGNESGVCPECGTEIKT